MKIICIAVCALSLVLNVVDALDYGGNIFKRQETTLKSYVDAFHRLTRKLELARAPSRATEIDPLGELLEVPIPELYFNMLQAEARFLEDGKLHLGQWPPDVQRIWKAIDIEMIHEHESAGRFVAGRLPDKVMKRPLEEIREAAEKRRSFIPETIPADLEFQR